MSQQVPPYDRFNTDDAYNERRKAMAENQKYIYDEGTEVPTILYGEDSWWRTYANVVTLAEWLADNDFPATTVAHAVGKPWKYNTEYIAARHGIDNHDLNELLDEENDEATLERRIVDIIKRAELA
jgi:hypothetical protein